MKNSEIENINFTKEDFETIKEIDRKIIFFKQVAIYLNIIIIFICFDIFIFFNIFFQITAFLTIICCMYLLYILLIKMEP